MPERKMRPGRPTTASVAAGLLIAAASLGSAGADVPAAGDWRGAGRITTEAGAPARLARCRATVDTSTTSGRDAATTFAINGRCAVASGRSSFTLFVVWNGSGAVSAVLTAPALSRQARFSGERHGDRIDLASTSLFEQGGKRHSSQLVIEFLDDDKFSVTEWQRPEHGGEARVSLSLDFERDHRQH